MKIRILKSEADYEAALVEIEKLMESPRPDVDRLELLALLVSDYEDKHYPIDMPDPVEAITFRMEQMGLTRKDLERYIGSRSEVSEVLSGKRRLSLSMIRALHKGLGIPAEVLLGRQGRPELENAAEVAFGLG
jgi:HTH-type transcriptional regulator/antitoxin HigA